MEYIDLLFYGLFALPRKCPAPGGFDPKMPRPVNFDPCHAPKKISPALPRPAPKQKNAAPFIPACYGHIITKAGV